MVGDEHIQTIRSGEIRKAGSSGERMNGRLDFDCDGENP
jgi:hypothetical protein